MKNDKNDEDLKAFKKKVDEDLKIFEELAKEAFSDDPNVAFEGSIKFAKYCGVPEEKILKSQEDIDKFFLG